MPDDLTLDDEMQLLWDHGHLLLISSPFDREAAIDCEAKLRDCAARARGDNRRFGATQLERVAKQLSDGIKAEGSSR
jgi:hypothetical protein